MWLDFGEDSIILYGQSMGSAAILRAVAVHNVQAEAIIIEAVFDRMLSTVQTWFAAAGIPSFPAAQSLIFWASIQTGFWGFDHNPVEYAREVEVPTLVLHGTEDNKADIVGALVVFDNLGGEKYFVSFADVGHTSYLESAPDKWKSEVERFLYEIDND